MDRLTKQSTRAIPLLAATIVFGVVAWTAVPISVVKAANRVQDNGAGNTAQEAPAAFDNESNGLETPEDFKKVREAFEENENKEDGLGPIFNLTSCVACHGNPITGSSSQIAEIRAGRRVADPNDPNPKKVQFKEPPGGSVIQQRAIDPAIQELVRPEDDVRTLRMSNSILGDGFVEVIPDEEILKVKKAQKKWGLEGFAVVVPVTIAATSDKDGKPSFETVERIGRFGWKCQEASLLNFSAGAYLNEMGITSPLQPEELTSLGKPVAAFDSVPDPEDKTMDDKDPKKTPHPFGVDVEQFTRFMRATKAPPRDTKLVKDPDVIEGEKLFRNDQAVGCAICHQPQFTTPPAGTKVLTLDGKQGSDMKTVPAALGGKIIHPYSDFMLHDIGTGDGIAQTQHADLPGPGRRNPQRLSDEIRNREGIGRVETVSTEGTQRVLRTNDALDQRTANKIRTAPLWGLRVRPQLMHDGLSLTIDDAIRRHGGQAEGVRIKYESLSDQQRQQLIKFLSTL